MAKSRKYFTLNPTLQPGQTTPYALAGNYLTCLDATASFRVAFDGEDFAEFDAGFTAEIQGGFQQVWIENTSASAITLKLAIGNGRFNDGRLTASGTVDVADPGAGQESFSDVVTALYDIIAAHREDRQLRSRLTPLDAAQYAGVNEATATIVSAASNTNGIIIRFAHLSGKPPFEHFVRLGGDDLFFLAKSATSNSAEINTVTVRDLQLPSGVALTAELGNTGRLSMWYEVL